MQESIDNFESALNKLSANEDRRAIEKTLASQAAGNVETIPMPWSRLSDKTKALRPGCLVIVGGPTKTGKSFFLGNICWRLYVDGHRWSYLPLEDSRQDFLWRMLAIITGDYQMIDTDQATVEKRREAWENCKDSILEIGKNVSENPRYGHRDKNGETVIPALPHTKVLSWAKDAAKNSRVVVIDPIAQIEFGGRERWKTEAEFVRHLLAIAVDSRATMVVAGHTVKRGGANAQITPSVEDFQGAAEWTRLAHTVILLDGHETKTSQIVRHGGCLLEEEHNRTVIIGAARNGSGTRTKIAYNQSHVGPSFEELGIISPKQKGKK